MDIGVRLDHRQGRDDRDCRGRFTRAGRRRSPSAFARCSATRLAYLSFDIDALDPAFAPGTGTPGGRRAVRPGRRGRSCAGSPGCDFRGMDVVEVSPPYDVAEITALAAATMAWDYLGLLAPRAR